MRPNARFDLGLARFDHGIVLERGAEFLGTGPYMLDSGTETESFRLVRNPYRKQAALVPEIECRVYPMDVNGGRLALVAMIAGSIGLQYPIGWLADRMPRRALCVACALATAGSAALMPLAVRAPPFFWALVFIWGGAYYAIYTLSLVRLGERFTGSALVAGNAARSL